MSEELRRPVVAGVEERGDAVIVYVAGELDLYNADELRTVLDEAAAAKPARIVIDLGELTFTDSIGIGVLVGARSAFADKRGLLLAAPQRDIRRILEVSGLDRILPAYDTVEEALAAPL